jgi:hypothetical protein
VKFTIGWDTEEEGHGKARGSRVHTVGIAQDPVARGAWHSLWVCQGRPLRDTSSVPRI